MSDVAGSCWFTVALPGNGSAAEPEGSPHDTRSSPEATTIDWTIGNLRVLATASIVCRSSVSHK
jgi:hypothetical protein